MSTETWKTIEQFPDYLISDHGRVQSLKFGKSRILRPGSSRGYPTVTLSDSDGISTRKVHRLVLEAFVGPCPEDSECRHLNGNRADARLVNLTWGSKTENEADKLRHGTSNHGERSSSAKLRALDVRQLREFHAQGASLQVLAEVFEISYGTVSNIVHGRRWKLPHHQPRVSSTEQVQA